MEFFKSKKTNESDGELPEAGTEPFMDTISGAGPSGSPAVTETTFADLHPETGVWTHMPTSMLKHADHEPPVNIDDQLYDLLAKAYSYIGGHVDFRKPSDIPANHTIWYGLDTDGDKVPNAVKFGKDTPFGRKWTGSATDGSPAAKKDIIDDTVRLMRTPGNFCEMSDAIAHIMMARYHIPCVDNQRDVEKVIGKKVKWIGSHPDGKYPDYHGFYERELGGEAHMKILLGEPKGIHSESFVMKSFCAFIESTLDTDTEDKVPNLEVLEDEDEDVLPHDLVPGVGVTDHLFSEAEDDGVVPSEIAVSDRLYTESVFRWKRLR